MYSIYMNGSVIQEVLGLLVPLMLLAYVLIK